MKSTFRFLFLERTFGTSHGLIGVILKKYADKSGNESPENIAFTNIIKCNASPSVDLTTRSQKNHCIKEMRVLKQEIEILNPNILIFYTSWNYDEFFEDILDNFVIKDDKKIKIGKKYIPWKTGTAEIRGEQIRCLRTGHPERILKTEFTKTIADWIKEG